MVFVTSLVYRPSRHSLTFPRTWLMNLFSSIRSWVHWVSKESWPVFFLRGLAMGMK